jgi:beta-xylosidase
LASALRKLIVKRAWAEAPAHLAARRDLLGCGVSSNKEALVALRATLTKLAAVAGLLCIGAATPAAHSFVPVHRNNFPDAFVVPHGGGFIAYATNDGVNLPMLTSSDLVTWTPVMDPARPGERLDGLPELGAWAKEDFTWAPEVFEIGGRWLLYYTASSRKLDAQCIGVAVADNPRGPFRDPLGQHLICQEALGGTIDANVVQSEDGKHYLYYKNDGNRIRKPTALWGQQLAADGLSVIGQPVQLLGDRERWKDRVIEAPTMVRSPGGYQMFYSAGYYGWNPEDRLSPYSMGYANCTGPLGPCVDAPDNPILHSFNDRESGCVSGPGHQSVFKGAGRTFVSFHAWAATPACRKLEDERYLYIAPLFWKDGKPQIGPSLRPRGASEPG